MIALLRTELVKAVWRTRTLVIAALLVGLPVLVLTVTRNRALGEGKGAGPNGVGVGLVRLTRETGLLAPAAMLNLMSGFLLVVVAGLFAGDSVAGDRSWGNLRYLLLRPVGRLRLLAAKALVAATFIWAAVLLVALAGLLAGVAIYGAGPLTVPFAAFSGAAPTISAGGLVVRTLAATAYVAFGFSALLAVGVFLSTITSAPTGAVGGAVTLYIVSSILDGIEELGRMRTLLPTHYGDVWQQMFFQNRVSPELWSGIVVQLLWLVTFGAAAAVWFVRRDVRA